MSFDETYFDDTAKVRLHCDGPDCWVEIQHKTNTPESLSVNLEFLLQPRDHAQRPVGTPMLLHVQHCQLSHDPRTQAALAWNWLPPRLTPELLKRCHLRLRRDILSQNSKH